MALASLSPSVGRALRENESRDDAGTPDEYICAHRGHPIFDEIKASPEYRRSLWLHSLYRGALYHKPGYDSDFWWDRRHRATAALDVVIKALLEKHDVGDILVGTDVDLQRAVGRVKGWGNRVESEPAEWRIWRLRARYLFHSKRGNLAWAREHEIGIVAITRLNEKSWPLTKTARKRAVEYMVSQDSKVATEAREAEEKRARRADLAARQRAFRDFLLPFFMGRPKQAWKKGFTNEALAYVAAQVEGLEWVTERCVADMSAKFYDEKEEAFESL